MKKVSINLYKLEELDPKVQEKVIKDFRDNLDFPFLDENLNENLKELLKKNKIHIVKNLKLYYSLNNCQGDGVCFVGAFNWKNYKVCINHIGRYNHEKSTEIILETKNYKIAKESVYEDFKKVYFAICQELEKIGYSHIEYEYEEKTIRENIEVNEYEFMAEGRRL